MKKGLRPRKQGFLVCQIPLKPCPDEEGIKTAFWYARFTPSTLKPCPDEEGIKTAAFSAVIPKIGFKTLP